MCSVMCAQTRDLCFQSHLRRLCDTQLIPYPWGSQQKKRQEWHSNLSSSWTQVKLTTLRPKLQIAYFYVTKYPFPPVLAYIKVKKTLDVYHRHWLLAYCYCQPLCTLRLKNIDPGLYLDGCLYISMSISVDSPSDDTLNRGPLALLLWRQYEFPCGIDIVQISFFFIFAKDMLILTL